MRARLSVLLFVLLATILLSLGVPLGRSYAASQARRVYIDRLGDLERFSELIPDSPTDVDRRALLAELRRYEDVHRIPVAVLDADGSVSVTSRPGIPGTDPPARRAVRAALAGRAGEPPDRIGPARPRTIVVAQPIVREGDVVGAVVSVSDPVAARHRVLRMWLLLLAAELVALAAGLALVQRLARWVLRPVAVLDWAAHRIASGNLSVRVPSRQGPAQLRHLGQAFNHMAEAVQTSLETQRAFVADASHQLRNPLGALLIRLQGLAMSDSPAPEAIARALDDGQHLAESLDRMLELARAEHVGTPAGAIDAAAVLDERLASWRAVAARRSIVVDRVGPPSAPAWHEAAALGGAVDVVVDNAVKYGPQGSVITVEVRRLPATGPPAGSPPAGSDPAGCPPAGSPPAGSPPAGSPPAGSDPAGSDAGLVQIVVTDEGDGVAAEDLARVTDRFWRSRNHPDVPGTGLGLSIATALLERHGGRLHIDPAEPHGLRVTLDLPAQPAASETRSQSLSIDPRSAAAQPPDGARRRSRRPR